MYYWVKDKLSLNSYIFMVDAADSKSAGGDPVRVRVSPWAHLEQCTIVSEKKLPVLIKIVLKRLKTCFYRLLC